MQPVRGDNGGYMFFDNSSNRQKAFAPKFLDINFDRSAILSALDEPSPGPELPQSFMRMILSHRDYSVANRVIH